MGTRFGKVDKVVLHTGDIIEADMVVVGAGAELNDEMAKEAGLKMDHKVGGVKTNPFMQTSNQDIFAAGDLASFPSWYVGENIRSEHWTTGIDQGTSAAFNMLGKMIPYGNVPFWTQKTMAINEGMQFVGHADSWDTIHIDGSINDKKFIAYYIKDNKVLGALGLRR